MRSVDAPAEGARCPIGTERIDENAARINGAIVVALLALAIATPYRWILGLLAADFAFKVFVGFASSPTCKATRALADALRLPRRMTDSAPKRFAATLGLVMTSLALVAAYAFPTVPVGTVIAATVLVLAALEAVAGVCVGCLMYRVLPERASRLFMRPRREGV